MTTSAMAVPQSAGSTPSGELVIVAPSVHAAAEAVARMIADALTRREVSS